MSARISDYSHLKWCNFIEYVGYKLTLFRVRRYIALFGSTFGAMTLGYICAGHGNNFFTMGYRQGFV